MRSKPFKRRSTWWERLSGIRIVDPDGWRADHTPMTKPLTREEWKRRMLLSTVGWKGKLKGEWLELLADAAVQRCIKGGAK